MTTRVVQLGDELFRFTSLQHWSNKAQGWFLGASVPPGDTVCIDAQGRLCRYGAQFMRAQEEGSYPIVVYRADPVLPAEDATHRPEPVDGVAWVSSRNADGMEWQLTPVDNFLRPGSKVDVDLDGEPWVIVALFRATTHKAATQHHEALMQQHRSHLAAATEAEQ